MKNIKYFDNKTLLWMFEPDEEAYQAVKEIIDNKLFGEVIFLGPNEFSGFEYTYESENCWKGELIERQGRGGRA